MTPAEKRARMKRGEGSPAARRPGGEPPTAGDGWGVSFRRLGGWERAAGRRVSSLASAHWRRCAISARFLAQCLISQNCRINRFYLKRFLNLDPIEILLEIAKYTPDGKPALRAQKACQEKRHAL